MAISGTHTHSGPAGFLQYVLFQITSFGYVKETFDAWVDGISNAIIIAHRNLQNAKVYINNGKLVGSNINRSPTSYLLNPQSERDMYEDGDTDKNMMLLYMANAFTQKPLGVLNWFAGKCIVQMWICVVCCMCIICVCNCICMCVCVYGMYCVCLLRM